MEIDASLVGTLELAGLEVPYVDIEAFPDVRSRLLVAGIEYAYERTFPIKGHSAVMPAAIEELLADGKRILVAERDERYYVYLA